MEYIIKQASLNDKEWIYELNYKCYKDVVIAQFNKWDEEFQRENFEKKWKKANYMIIQYNNNIIGIYSINYKNDHIFLSEILIDPLYQNKGHGTKIIKQIIDESKSKNLGLKLQVLIKNRAKKLYNKLGFIEYEKTDTHYKMEYINRNGKST